MARRNNDFQAIRSEGGLLPTDLLRRVLNPKANLEGMRPEDYGLSQGERLNEIITQSWNRLRRHWSEFRTAAAGLPEGEAGTGLTNEKWSLPLLRELGFGMLPTTPGPEIGGRTYAINRFFGPVPVHLIGCGLSLDRRAAGVRGAASVNPHGLVQEFLNRSPGHLWGIVSNGLRLRILRDSQALSRQSFLEFDIETMFAGEVYSDFVLLWLMGHATRFAPREAQRPETCWLEQWTRFANEQGARALGDLRNGVEKALQLLGEGFTSHPRNTGLRDALRTGQISPVDFHGQLLRVIYRLIFLFVAEDRTLEGRPLLHPWDSSDAAGTARERYTSHYSTARLRELAGKIKGSRHGDLWRQFQLLVGALSGDDRYAAVRKHLALPALGSFLWNPIFTASLNDAELTNHDLLEVLRNLAYTRQGRVLRPVDFKNLGAEELGGVYESLLALTPQLSTDGARFTFAEFAGNERKTSGSYYTPDCLVQCLLNSALDPVVEEAIKGKTGAEAEKAILALKVCDPAVGSGHFLVGAAHRLARHLARVRALAQGESEPSPLLYQHALRDVIGRCLYGVDLSPMAAELCRVSFWLEALEPGKPLSFLDHHIRVGNSLLGTTPELIAAGLPDEAFTAIEGDDKKICSALKKRNKLERAGQMDMLHLLAAEPEPEYNSIAVRIHGIEEVPDDTIDTVQRKADQFHKLIVSPEYRHGTDLADAWCAAFVWQKQANNRLDPITTETIRRLEKDLNALSPSQRTEVQRLLREYQFFHWHLAFPEVFAQGGFDCVLGNPPWERVKIQEKEWFAERSPEIANAPNTAARKRLIEVLKTSDPDLYRSFLNDSRKAEGESHFMRNSGRYPLCGRGDINVYTVFAEGMRNLLNERGCTGCVVPTGIATDDTTKLFYQDVVERKSLVSLFDFENKGIFFPGVHSSYKFCLFTGGRGVRPTTEATEFVFFAHSVEDLHDPKRRFRLSLEELTLLSPASMTMVGFRSAKDKAATLKLYRSCSHSTSGERDTNQGTLPSYQLTQGTFHSSNDSRLFSVEPECSVSDGTVPLLEPRLFHLFDHRYSTWSSAGQFEPTSLDQHRDPSWLITTRYWVPRVELSSRLRSEKDGWVLAYRRVARSTDERTMICAIIPTRCINENGVFITSQLLHPKHWASMCANLASFCLDYCLRQRDCFSIGNADMQQQPLLPLSTYGRECVWSPGRHAVDEWVLTRALELTYTATDLGAFAKDCGWSGPPFRWDEDRRFLLRCELDAAFFHLYLPTTTDGQWKPARKAEGAVRDETPDEFAELKKHFPTPRDAVAYIMDTFPIVRRKDEEKYSGDYRTERVILEIYDAMQESIRAGEPYQTRLDPPPADPRMAHPPRT